MKMTMILEKFKALYERALILCLNSMSMKERERERRERKGQERKALNGHLSLLEDGTII